LAYSFNIFYIYTTKSVDYIDIIEYNEIKYLSKSNK